ncbi:MAG: 50S ribosomal protein L29 [Candidatus Anstonellaceae archaeon]
MAIIRKSNLRTLSDAELSQKLFQFRKELNAERGVIAAGGRSSNPGKVRQLKLAIARILTILHERKLGLKKPAASAAEQKEVKTVA